MREREAIILKPHFTGLFRRGKQSKKLFAVVITSSVWRGGCVGADSSPNATCPDPPFPEKDNHATNKWLKTPRCRHHP